jgi:hypothetical protein
MPVPSKPVKRVMSVETATTFSAVTIPTSVVRKHSFSRIIANALSINGFQWCERPCPGYVGTQ